MQSRGEIKRGCYLITLPVFMTNEKCSLNIATVWIWVAATEHFHVMIIVVMIDGAIKREQNHLGNLLKRENLF